MPDLDPLPHRPGAPSFAPRPEDYAVVVGRARSRRRRQAGVATAGLAGVAAAVALTVGGGGGSFGLRQVDPTTGGPAATATPPAEPARPGASGAPEAEPRDASSEPAAPDAGYSGSSGSSGEPGPPARTGRPDPSPGPTEPPERPARSRPSVHFDEVPNDPTEPCETDPSLVSATGWCLRYEGPDSVRAGDVHSYRVLACRHVGRGGRTLTFDTEQQVEFAVLSESRTEWTWSGGYRFAEVPTSVHVPESRCARWTVKWDATGSDGEFVRPGAYSMSPNVLTGDWADDFGGAMAVGMGFSLDVTE